MCLQKYAQITLKSYNDDGKIVDSQFSFKSHCICELVALKKEGKRLTEKLQSIQPWIYFTEIIEK